MPAKAVVVGGLGDGDGHSGLHGEDGVEGPAAESAGYAGGGEAVAAAGGEVVDGGEGEDVGHVAVGGVALEVGAEGVGGDERAGVGRGEDGGGEDGGGVVDEFGVGVGEEEIEAVGDALLDLGLEGVVVGGAGVVAVDGDVLEAGIGLEELSGGDGRGAEGAGGGKLAVVGVGDLAGEGCCCGWAGGAGHSLRGGELVEILSRGCRRGRCASLRRRSRQRGYW